jgi:hypothetical protein
VRTEVDRAAGRLGFVREEELAAVRRHVSRLEGQLADIRTQIGGDAGAAAAAAATTGAAPKPVKKKVPVKRAPSAHDTPDSDAETSVAEPPAAGPAVAEAASTATTDPTETGADA